MNPCSYIIHQSNDFDACLIVDLRLRYHLFKVLALRLQTTKLQQCIVPTKDFNYICEDYEK